MKGIALDTPHQLGGEAVAEKEMNVVEAVKDVRLLLHNQGIWLDLNIELRGAVADHH